MMTLLPSGAIGLVVASLTAAFMHISSHLNWGSSYVVHDFITDLFDQMRTTFGRSRPLVYGLLMLFSGRLLCFE